VEKYSDGVAVSKLSEYRSVLVRRNGVVEKDSNLDMRKKGDSDAKPQRKVIPMRLESKLSKCD